MSETPEQTAKVRRTPAQIAWDALIAADDRVQRAAKRVEKAKAEVEKAEAEHKRVVAARNYVVQHPDLPAELRETPEQQLPETDEAPGESTPSTVV